MNTKNSAFAPAHPIMILFNLKRFVVLIIIPVVRGFLAALGGGFASWFRGAWADLLILFIIVALATLHWRFYRYSFGTGGLVVSRGILQQQVVTLPWGNVSTLAVTTPFYLRPFGAVCLRADALGGNRRSSDIVLYLTPATAEDIAGFFQTATGAGPVRQSHTPSAWSVFLLSVLSGGSLAGLLYLGAFISQSGKILGRRFQDLLIGTFEDFTRSLAFQIPPAAIAITYVLFIAWLIGVLITLSRYYHFSVTRLRGMVHLSGGLLTSRDYFIPLAHIRYWDIRQNLFTCIFRLYSLYLSAVGCGKERKDLTCVVPLTTKIPFRNAMFRLFPHQREFPVTLRPPARTFMRFLRDPLIFCGAIPLVSLGTIYFIPSWRSFISFVGAMAMIPSLVFLVVRILDYRTTGLARRGNLLTMKYSRGFTLHTLLLTTDHIVKYRMYQGVLQKQLGRCDLYVYTVSETRERHRCRNLSTKDVLAFLSLSS